MFNYKVVVKRFLKCCERDEGKGQALFEDILDKLPARYKVDFIKDVLETRPFVVDLFVASGKVIASKDAPSCVALLQSSLVPYMHLDKALQTVLFYGSDKDYFDTLMCLDIKSKCTELKRVKMDDAYGLNVAHSIYLMDKKLTAGQSPQYNLDILDAIMICDLGAYVNVDEHIDAVLDSKDSESVARLVSQYRTYRMLDDEHLARAVAVLCDKKCPSRDKYTAMTALEQYSDAEYKKIRTAILSRRNPLYTRKVNKLPQRDIPTAFIEDKSESAVLESEVHDHDDEMSR